MAQSANPYLDDPLYQLGQSNGYCQATIVAVEGIKKLMASGLLTVEGFQAANQLCIDLLSSRVPENQKEELKKS